MMWLFTYLGAGRYAVSGQGRLEEVPIMCGIFIGSLLLAGILMLAFRFFCSWRIRGNL
jgi:hypothetical protein